MTADHTDYVVELGVVCLACGFDLKAVPWWPRERSWEEICVCCGIQYGLDDVIARDGIAERVEAYAVWRKAWVLKGMPWFSLGASPLGAIDFEKNLSDLDWLIGEKWPPERVRAYKDKLSEA